MTLIFRVGWLSLILVLFTTLELPAEAQIAMAPKQLFVIKPGTDLIHGTWVAAVMNKGQTTERFSVPVLLPKEAKDFQPIEGIGPDDLKLSDDGLTVEKEFPPGVHVISLGFMLPVALGRAEIHVKARADVGELTVMTPRGLLEISGRELVDGGTDVQDMQRYQIFTSNRMILAGDDLSILITGVPEGRGRLWIVGLAFASMLMIAAAILVKKSAPREKTADV